MTAQTGAAQAELRTRNLNLIALILIGAAAISFVVYSFLRESLGEVLYWAQVVVIAAVILGALAGLFLARRGKTDTAAWVIILPLYSALGIIFLVADIGLVLGGTVLLVNVLIGRLTMSPRSAALARVISITAGVATILVDLFHPLERVSVPALTAYLPLVFALVIAALGALVWREFPRYSLRLKLAVVFVALTVATLIGLDAALARNVQQALVSQIGAGFTSQAVSLSGTVAGYFEEKLGQLQVLAVSDVVETAAEEGGDRFPGTEADILARIQELDAQWVSAPADDPLVQGIIAADKDINVLAYELAEFSDAFPEHIELMVTDAHGAVVAANNRLSDFYQADEEWWQAAWNAGAGAVYISNPVFGESAQVVGLQLALPIREEETGEVVGILRSTLVLNDLRPLIEEFVLGDTGHAVLLDGAGEILIDPRAGGEERGSAALPDALRQGFLRAEAGSLLAFDEHGDQSIFGHAVILGEQMPGETGENTIGGTGSSAEALAALGWVIMVRQEASEALAPVEQIQRLLVLASLVVILLAALAANWLAGRIASPIAALSAAAGQLGAGQLDVPLPPAGEDEIGVLTASFADMSIRLRETLAGLEQRVADRTQALSASLEVSRRLSTILDERQLVATVVNEVRQSFNYYHAHIYVLDPAGGRLVMAGGTGNAGRQMLAQGHALDAGQGLVGRAAATREVVLVPDVALEPGWLPNALLPDTQAEIAVPIIAGETLLGVLDVQHNVRGGLGSSDASLLESVANQVAIGLQNARSFEATRAQAGMEILINEIVQKIQRAASIESVLQTAARELGQTPGVKRATVRLALEPQDGRDRAG
jgi:putative methionine-R-sulfoxide reductase with GAF domain